MAVPKLIMKKTLITLLLIVTVFEAQATSPIFVKSNSKIYSSSSASTSNFVFGSSDTNDVEGYSDDDRMFLLKSNGAFVAGNTISVEDIWRDDNLGQGAIILGSDSEASGERSISLGYVYESEGEGSISIGMIGTATADHNINIGHLIDNAGENTIALGRGGGYRLNASNSNSLYIGTTSSAPTLYVAPASGASTVGRVGIANSDPHPDAALDVAGAIKVAVVSEYPVCDASTEGTIVYYDPHNAFKGCKYFGDGVYEYAWTFIESRI